MRRHFRGDPHPDSPFSNDWPLKGSGFQRICPVRQELCPQRLPANFRYRKTCNQLHFLQIHHWQSLIASMGVTRNALNGHADYRVVVQVTELYHSHRPVNHRGPEVSDASKRLPLRCVGTGFDEAGSSVVAQDGVCEFILDKSPAWIVTDLWTTSDHSAVDSNLAINL